MIQTQPVQTTVAAGLPCSERYYQLERMSSRALETVFLRGQPPDVAQLVGWEFRGTNVPGWAKLAGIKKFIKGFYLHDGDAYGYNCPVVQNGIQAPWIASPTDDDPKRFGFYRVAPVDATSRDNEYLHAVLLDYGRGGNKKLDPTAGLRDYLVRVDAENPDLYLGKAYYAVGPLRVATNFFLLERHRRGPTDLSRG
ncbi:MAG TPA: hypothetical protein VML75_25610 [Kofleriaceae bacterium]|nr:hypothetical protein [Kofleriaceae bacterium]